MEDTPKSRYSHQKRIPTPRLLTRRKSLFSESPVKPKSLNTSEPLIEDLEGIAFLEEHDKSVEEVLQNVSCLSSSGTPKNVSPPQNEEQIESPVVKRIPSIDQELPNLLNSMSLKKTKKDKSNNKENMMMSAKRAMMFSPRKEEPASKVLKLQDKKVSPIDTRHFYSNERYVSKAPKIQPFIPPKQPKSAKIRKRRKSLHRNQLHLKPTSIENILKTINSDKLKSRILAHREQKRKLDEVHKILQDCQNPIALAVPLNIDKDNEVSCDFSDVEECEIEEAEVEILDENHVDFQEVVDEFLEEKDKEVNTEEEEPVKEVETKRKFFKSKNRVAKEVNIVGGLKADFLGAGKMSLKTPEVKRTKKRKYTKNYGEFLRQFL